MKPLSECKLYTFVDTAYLKGRTAEHVAAELCQGGADLIQLRAKDSSVEEVRQLARAVLAITQPAGVGLVINDYHAVAREVGADFCHLGQEDFFNAGFQSVQELRPPDSTMCVGLSTHQPSQALHALKAGADYLAVGPVYPTATKPSARPVTLEYVRWAAANLELPWFAIGGINLHNLDDVLAAGAWRICVVSAILNSDDIAARCKEFKTRLEQQPGAK
jgi:thiamine-phosphate pyrophosphorylase